LRRNQWKQDQILEVLKAADAPGASVQEVCRIYGVSQSCVYRWRQKHEGVEISQRRQVKELEEQNRRLKDLLATRELELDAVRRLLRKNSYRHSSGGPR